MRSKWLTFVFILSLTVNAAVMVSVGYHYYMSASAASTAPCPLSPGDSHLYQSLGLSDLQLSKMAPLARSFHGRLAELASAMEVKRQLMIDLLEKGNDPAAIEKLRKDMAGIQDEIQQKVIVHITETKEILDPRQQQRLFDLMRRRMVDKTWASSHGGK
jgi:Spy/CpxP family protein refolding chaperone